MSAVPWWASDDPWAMSPAERQSAEERHREWLAQLDEIPVEPPELKVTR